MLVRAASMAARAAETGLSPIPAPRGRSAAARSSSSCWAETAPRWERVLERTWRFAVESSSAGAASLPLRWHAFHFVADRARLWRRDRAFRFLDLRGGFKTLLVQYPGIHSRQHLSGARTTLLTRMVSIRPAILLAISTSVASIRPLLLANPPGVPAAQQPPCGGGEHHQ